MPFNSFQFLAFFAFGVVVSFLLPARYRWLWLLALSYIFYATWSLTSVVWLVATTLVIYLLAILIARTASPVWRKVLLALGLIFALGLLAILKYAGFFGETLRVVLSDWSGLGDVSAAQILLPVGLSFYLFQAQGYLIDVYRGQIPAERHLGRLALFMSFFPKIVAGPIERAGNLLAQFQVEQRPDLGGIVTGLQLVLWGLFKKVVVADRLAVYVDAVYNNPADHRGLPVLLATYLFALQIYCDFSGYTHIALGTARILGYNLIPNFARPYCATSIADFWRRWHMSLSSWFRDYLYIPLGGSRVPRWRWYANLMIVFVLSGLWHGANWTFVIWGALHGFYYIVQTWLAQPRERLFQALHIGPALRVIIAILVTVNLVSLAWVFFRASTLSDAWLVLRNMVQFGASTDLHAPWEAAAAPPAVEMPLALFLTALPLAFDLAYEHSRPALLALWRHAWVRWLVYVLLAMALLNLGAAREAPFVYQQF